METATDICSVAFSDGDGKVHEKRSEERGSHSEQLFLFIEELMEEHGFGIPDLEVMIVSEGPGSYTGLRISASAVKGLLFQTDTPLYAVNTLAGFAQSAVVEKPELNVVHSVIDARRVHLYHQKFRNSDESLVAESKVEVLPIEKVESMIKSEECIIGTGIDRIDQSRLDGVEKFGSGYIRAQSLIHIYARGISPFIQQVSPDEFDPKYYTSRQIDP